VLALIAIVVLTIYLSNKPPEILGKLVPIVVGMGSVAGIAAGIQSFYQTKAGA
jgi:hypothetical protein